MAHDKTNWPQTETDLLTLSRSELKEMFVQWAERLEEDFEATFPLLCTLLTGEEPAGMDYLAEIGIERIKEEALNLLVPYADQELVFDFLAEVLNRDDQIILRKSLLDNLTQTYTRNSIIPRLSAEQAQRVLACCLQSAQRGSPVYHEARRVIFYFEHPGVEEALIAALQQATDEEVKRSLYSAIRNLPTTGARTALVERLLVETNCHWGMANSLHEIFDQAVHQQALALIARTNSIMGANNYTATLAEHVKQGRPLVELVELILSWPAVAASELPGLKYVLLEGARAALLQHKPTIAKNAFLRAREITGPAVSVYHATRKNAWQDPFEQDLGLQKRMQELLDGTSEIQEQALYQKSEKARRQNKPLTRVSDQELGVMAGVDLQERLFRDAETKEIWFLDINGAFCYFDGYWVENPPFEPIINPDKQAFLADVTTTTRRLMFWANNGYEFQEFVQYQQRILSYRGINNGRWQTYGLIAPNETAASTIMQRLHLHMDKKRFVESTPWYLPGHGAVIRTYHTLEPDGHYSSKQTMLGIIGKRWLLKQQTFSNNAQAIQTYEEWELQKFKEGIHLTRIEWMKYYKSPEDMMLVEYLQKRLYSQETEIVWKQETEIIWQMEILEELQSYLQTYNLADLLPDLEITVGSGIAEEDLENIAAKIGDTIPEELLTFWQRFGHASWRLGEQGMRILSPTEMMQRHATFQQSVTDIIQQQFSPGERVFYRERFEHAAVVMETFQETPTMIWTTTATEKVFCHFELPMCASGLQFEENLTEILQTRFLTPLFQTMLDAAPDLRFLKYGRKRDPAAMRQRFELNGKTPAKFWEVIFDKANQTIATYSGKIGLEGAFSFRDFPTDQATEKAYLAAIAKKRQEGYLEVTPSTI
jgi:predicted DNA-binding WGR domain protein